MRYSFFDNAKALDKLKQLPQKNIDKIVKHVGEFNNIDNNGLTYEQLAKQKELHEIFCKLARYPIEDAIKVIGPNVKRMRRNEKLFFCMNLLELVNFVYVLEIMKYCFHEDYCHDVTIRNSLYVFVGFVILLASMIFFKRFLNNEINFLLGEAITFLIANNELFYELTLRPYALDIIRNIKLEHSADDPAIHWSHYEFMDIYSNKMHNFLYVREKLSEFIVGINLVEKNELPSGKQLTKIQDNWSFYSERYQRYIVSVHEEFCKYLHENPSIIEKLSSSPNTVIDINEHSKLSGGFVNKKYK